MSNYFVGVDVGTGSVRAALVTENGKVVEIAEQETKTWNPKPDFYEQSSEDIWAATIRCVKTVVKGVDPKSIKGLGFDATCSLVAIDKQGRPLSVSPTGNHDQNIILWLDHRAKVEADFINSLQHPVLKYVGGKISLEMETPKLLWIKKNLRKECWDRAGLFFDLPDFLTWKATGSESRSLCSLVCKWTYVISETGNGGWSADYFKQVGMGDLLENNGRKIGETVLHPGAPIPGGLSERAAKELGLLPGTPVGTSMIDAHAGGLGLIGCSPERISVEFHSRLALICGTSTCHMAVSKGPVFVPGVWGPYYSAMVPGMWLNEGGQSATGKLVDYVIDSHPATPTIKNKIGKMHIQQYLTDLLEQIRKRRNLTSSAFLTESLHVYPDFHGNRSPIADPTLKGMISGLTLSSDEENLALLYLATIQALSYGTRHIVEALIQSGHKDISSILICGGLSKNALFVQTQADVAKLPVLCPLETESVVLGASILGACASGCFSDVVTALKSMGGVGNTVLPDKDVLEYHDKKYKVFLEMLHDQRKYERIMK